MFDVIIVGCGVAGVASAYEFASNGVRVCLLDVGYQSGEEKNIEENFYAYGAQNDSFALTIGHNFEGLYNLDASHKAIPAKLCAPNMGFVIQKAGELGPVRGKNFSAVQSFAKGGLANAWGAGLYRYTENELDGFPLQLAELNPYYDKLTGLIGICGQEDDLAFSFGSAADLQRPLRLSRNAAILHRHYQRKREKFNRQGVFVGRPRLGILTEDKDGRAACDYSNLEFWQANLPYIYTPAMTLDQMIADSQVDYRPNILVTAWRREKDDIVIHGKDLAENGMVEFRCKYLLLAAGPINTAKIVLQTKRDFQSRLSLLDNPCLIFPIIFPSQIGRALETDSFGLTQLNIIWDRAIQDRIVQGSILEVTSPARAEFFASMPLAARDNLRLIKYMLPAMLALQVFFPADMCSVNALSLCSDGTLEIEGDDERIDKQAISKIIRTVRQLGGWCFPRIVVHNPKGYGIHYAGTLPMRSIPSGNYECNPYGELFGEPNVFVVDGSVFPRLPAKNYSFTVMANAMRIAGYIIDKIRMN